MFAIDIDGTIAHGNPDGLLDYLRERLRLPLLDVPTGLTWAGVEELPEIKAYREENSRRYRRVRNQAMGSLLVLRAATPMLGAADALQRLAQHQEVVYVTIRAGDDASAETTKRWLRDAGFPNPNKVTFCASFVHKVTRVLREPGDHVLIDDRWRDVVIKLQKLQKTVNGDPRGQRFFEELERLTLVAFGTPRISEKDSDPLMHLVALPAWDRFEEYCESLLPAQIGV